MSATDRIMDEVRALVVLDITPESLGQLAALRHTIARTIGDLERARDAVLEERNRLGVELAGARTRLAMCQEQAMHAMAEADDLRAELAARLEAIERAEPVMWMARKADGRIAAWTSASDETIRLAREVGTEVRPLYACPHPPASEPARQPLTDEQIDDATAKARDALIDHIAEYGPLAEGQQKFIRKMARAIERAHGIGTETARQPLTALERELLAALRVRAMTRPERHEGGAA